MKDSSVETQVPAEDNLDMPVGVVGMDAPDPDITDGWDTGGGREWDLPEVGPRKVTQNDVPVAIGHVAYGAAEEVSKD